MYRCELLSTVLHVFSFIFFFSGAWIQVTLYGRECAVLNATIAPDGCHLLSEFGNEAEVGVAGLLMKLLPQWMQVSYNGEICYQDNNVEFSQPSPNESMMFTDPHPLPLLKRWLVLSEIRIKLFLFCTCMKNKLPVLFVTFVFIKTLVEKRRKVSLKNTNTSWILS